MKMSDVTGAQISINGSVKTPSFSFTGCLKALIMFIIMIAIFALFVWFGWKMDKQRVAANQKARKDRIDAIKKAPLCEPDPDSKVDERKVRRLVRKNAGQDIDVNDCISGTPVYLRSALTEEYVICGKNGTHLLGKKPATANFEFMTGMADYLDEKQREYFEELDGVYNPYSCETLNNLTVLIDRNDRDRHILIENIFDKDGIGNKKLGIIRLGTDGIIYTYSHIGIGAKITSVFDTKYEDVVDFVLEVGDL